MRGRRVRVVIGKRPSGASWAGQSGYAVRKPTRAIPPCAAKCGLPPRRSVFDGSTCAQGVLSVGREEALGQRQQR